MRNSWHKRGELVDDDVAPVELDDLLSIPVSPGVQDRSEKLAADTLRSMRLAELRKAFVLTQVDLAKRMGCSQARISEAEHRPDMMVSTFIGYLHGLGANPRVIVDVPGEGEVRVELDSLLKSGT
jgi:hypothetical protein